MSNYLLTDEISTVCRWITYGILCQLINIFGITTNIMNIICFVKLGFKDSVNVGLLGLAVADLCSLIPLIWTNICLTPAFITSDLPFEPLEFQYLVSGVPHTTFTRVSAWITAVIVLERCVCITAPLKVKSIITPRRVAVLIAFGIILLSVTPFYTVNKLVMKFYSTINKTLLGLVASDNREDVDKISFSINNVFIPFSAFFVITVCTIKLVVELRSTASWRKMYSDTAQADALSNRNQKVATMIVMISTLFIACFIPVSFVFLAAVIEPEFSLQGKYSNIVTLSAGIGFILESINSSANVFIYYRMSGKYKHVFLETCCC